MHRIDNSEAPKKKPKRVVKATPVPGQTGNGSGPAPAKPLPHAKVLTRIVRVAHEKRATPRELKSAVETGLVESRLRNLSNKVSDQDSAGWRQERKSLYPNPTNLNASITRYFDEARARRGTPGSAGDLAAAVQRPDARYRGRYHKRSKDADRLLKLVKGRVN